MLANPCFSEPRSRFASFLQTFKIFVAEKLQENYISPQESLFAVLQWTELDSSYLGDSDWFSGSLRSAGFPKSVLVEEAVAAYEMLKERLE